MSVSIQLLNTLLNAAYITAVRKPKTIKNLETHENEERGLPECISHKILLYVFGLEHKETMQRFKILYFIKMYYHCKKFHSRMENGEFDHDLKYICDNYFECNCCNRHQFRKVKIAYNDDNKECLHIINTIGPYRSIVSLIHPDEDTIRCECNCRHRTRWIARRWVSKCKHTIVPDTAFPSIEAERAYYSVGSPGDRDKFMSIFRAGLIKIIN